jgi:hypothetical protein
LPTSYMTLSSFRWLLMCLNLTNNSEVTIVQSCWYCWKFLFEPKEVTYWLQNLILEEPRPKKTLNIKVIGDFINSLRRGETRNFDTGWKNHEGSKLIRFLRYNFELEIFFLIFLLVCKVLFLMQYDSMMQCNMSVLYVPHQKKRLTKYRWRTYSQW